MGLDSFKNNFLQLKCIKKHNARAVNCENSSKAYSPSKLIFKLLNKENVNNKKTSRKCT